MWTFEDFEELFHHSNTSDLKIYAAFGIFLLDIIFSLLPFIIKSQKWTFIFEALASGVFLSTTFLHLIPESVHSLYGIAERPIGPFIWLSTFSFLLVFSLLTNSHHHNHGHEHENGHEEKDCHHKDKFKQDHCHKEKKSSSSCTFLYFTLIIHTVIEALSFGSVFRAPVLRALIISTIGHKPIETFSLGISLMKECTSKWLYIFLMFGYSSIEPIIIVSMSWFLPKISPLGIDLLSSISTGSFLFISFQEISEGLEYFHGGSAKIGQKLLYLFFFLLGAAWISFSVLYGDSDHHHHHHHSHFH